MARRDRIDNRDSADSIRETINTRPATREELAYRDGYTNAQKQQSDRLDYASDLRARDENNVTGGLLLGILLASAIAVVAGAFYYTSQANQTTPAPGDTQVDEPTTNETTIIERTIDRTQEVIPAEPPEVQITIPSPEAPDVIQQAPANPVDVAPQTTEGTSNAPVAPETDPSAADPSVTDAPESTAP